jgi:methyl-accepting chemotaxis protein
MARLTLEGVGTMPLTVTASSELGLHARFDEVSAPALERLDALIARVYRDTQPAIALTRRVAGEIAWHFAHAVDSGEIALDDLMSADYRPIAGTDPVQYTSASLGFCERALPPIVEAARAAEPRPLFVVATDRNAYAPVHHPEFSQAQRPGEPVWNDLHARNRRIYDRWLTLSGARNREPCSLRAYVRHQPDGTPLPMQVIAAPIVVHGHFWGNVQIGCAMA